jgi:hypothetical protein
MTDRFSICLPFTLSCTPIQQQNIVSDPVGQSLTAGVGDVVFRAEGVRTVMVELAWLWTRYQPGAAQVCWFRERVGSTGRRVCKIMVVALARKLLIALWRFVIDGVLPEGAVLKPAA